MPEGTETGAAAFAAGEGGGTAVADNKAWLSSVPEPLRGHDVFKEMKEAGEVYQRLIDLSEQSKGAVRIPGEDATEEQRKEFYKQIGGVPVSAPETPDAYSYQKPADWPEAISYNEPLLQSMKAKAHSLGMSDAQFSELAKAYDEEQRTAYTEISKIIESNKQKAVDALKELWPGDAYKANTEKTFQALKLFADKAQIPEKLGGKEGFTQWLQNSGMTHDPMFNYMWSRVFELVGDDSLLTGRQGGPGSDPLDEMFGRSMPKDKFS